MIFLRSLAFMIVFYVGSAIHVLLSAIFSRGEAGARKAAYDWARFHRWCARTILGITTRVEGAPPPYPVLYAFKHESMYETLEILLLVPEPAVLLKKELADIPVFGGITRRHGVIAIDREGGAKALRKLVAESRAAVARGRSPLIFPEGTRVPHGERPPLRSGFAGIYRAINLPVVPVAMDSGKLWPRKGFLKRPGVVTFRFGDVIQPGLDRDEAERRVHAAINALNK